MTKRLSKKSERAAFTLIELLVVVAIIAVLVAMLLPALNQARMQARKIQCMAHVKMVGGALIMYAHDNHDFYPSGSYTASDGLDWGWSGKFSCVWVTPIGIGGANLMWPYISDNPDVIFCPSNDTLKEYYTDPKYYPEQYESDGDPYKNTTYVPFCGRAKYYDGSPMRLSDPSDWPVWGDIASDGPTVAAQLFYNNHGIDQGGNWAFVDGHAEWVKREKLVPRCYNKNWISFLGPRKTDR